MLMDSNSRKRSSGEPARTFIDQFIDNIGIRKN